MEKLCCDDMSEFIYSIDQNDRKSNPNTVDKPIYYSSKFNEFGLPVYDGENGKATSYILIKHCPWCGKALPESRRTEWFECLERLGFETPFEDFDNIPPEFKTAEWYSTEK